MEPNLTAQPAPAFLNMVQAAQFLGLSTSMARKLARTERMPVKRFGRSVRIPFAWLVAEAASATRVGPTDTTGGIQ
jgi:excisionase family DNA binding protein